MLGITDKVQFQLFFESRKCFGFSSSCSCGYTRLLTCFSCICVKPITVVGSYRPPRQQKFRAMNGAHLASPIREEHGYAHWPQLGTQFIGHQIWGPLGQQDVCPNFALTAAKFVFSNSGNFRAKANPPKPRSCPKRPLAMNGEKFQC